MNELGLELSVCCICLAIGAQSFMYQYGFKKLLKSVCPMMTLEIPKDCFACCNCYNELLILNHEKASWLQNERILIRKLISGGEKINLSVFLNGNLPNVYEITNCRLCFIITNSVIDLSTLVDGISLVEMFRYGLPDLALELTYCPRFCDECAKKILMIYRFNRTHMETEQKIKTYCENTSTSLKRHNRNNLLMNIVQYFQNGENMDIPISSRFYEYICDKEGCDYSTFTEEALMHHQIMTHPLEYTLVCPQDTAVIEVYESGTPGDNIKVGESGNSHDDNIVDEIIFVTPDDGAISGKSSNIPEHEVFLVELPLTLIETVADGESSVTPSGGVNKIFIPSTTVFEMCEIGTPVDNVTIGESYTNHDDSVVDGFLFVTPDDGVISGKSSNTLGYEVLGVESPPTLIETVADGESSVTPSGGVNKIFIPSTTVFEMCEISTPADNITIGESYTNHDDSVVDGLLFVTPDDGVISGKSSNTLDYEVFGVESPPTLIETVIDRKSPVTPSGGVNKISIPSDTDSYKEAAKCSTSHDMGIEETSFSCNTKGNEHTSNLYNCDMCTYKTYNNSNLKRHFTARHINVHHCRICDFIGTTKSEVARHNVLKHHPNPHIFKCHECEYITILRRDLTRHVSRVHAKKAKLDRFFVCHRCPFKTKNSNDLIAHIITTHYRCDGDE